MALTPRRSRRFQPNVFANAIPGPSLSHNDLWQGKPLHTRGSTREDLLDDEELEEEDPRHTNFYDQFVRRRPVRQQPSGRSKKSSQSSTDKTSEVFRVGDTVLLATNVKKPSVGVLVGMWEVTGADDDDDEASKRVRVKVHWFLRPSELAKLRAKRDHYENEIYFSIDATATLASSAIISHCSVSGTPPLDADAAPPASKRTRTLVTADHGVPVYCALAVNARLGIFYDFDWERHREKALSMAPERGAIGEWGTGTAWVVPVQSDKRTRQGRDLARVDEEESSTDSEDGDNDDTFADPNTRKSRRDAATPSDSDASADEDDERPVLPRTPSKKRKRASTITPRSTPRKRGVSYAQPTPHSKKALRERAKKARRPVARPPPPELAAGMLDARLPADPWLRAMHILHVAARPEALPCRDEEYGRVMRSVEELIEEGSGGCVYISGVPGTGKTATVHAVVRELKRMAEQNETNPFTYVEINGLRIPEPAASYGVLWEALSGHDTASDGPLKISSKEALKNLTRHFGGRTAGPGGHACVVLMDELDQLMTAKQDVVYNFFNWPTLVGSKLVVIAVANTMDLPERVMSGRVRSRLGMIRINFQPYTTPQLEKIVRSRLESAKEGLRGDVPDVISADGIKFAAMKVSSVSGDARRVLDICRRSVELVQPLKRAARTEDVKEVIKVMQNSPTAAYMRDCSFHERLMLAALLKCIKKEGVEEIKWADLQHQHYLYLGVLASSTDSTRSPTAGELALVLDSLLASRALLIEEGAAAAKKLDGERRVVLNLEQVEVERVLSEVGGQRWKNALGVS
ncbi:P-loop containing nucleoside triphosphate hydrolase protein [Auriscalpium vulgare]|uniref:P-loop containing nucleoside triphosphate hydrolase protein n=1 Tax=Auriscalpium vulgare TaxID=40419 RepID=A0ACB8RUL8_9AGAM|nr:P-loop containing nucleoside triphosphate hydrolase protein [Auriscalpium vulgare]